MTSELNRQLSQGGWQTVPREATEAMIEAAYTAGMSDNMRPCDCLPHKIWASMIAASPTPPQGGADAGGVVTEEMVERACEAYENESPNVVCSVKAIRAALTAAKESRDA